MNNALSTDDIQLALELFQLTERIRTDTKRTEELKAYFKGNLPDGTLRLGPFELHLEEQTREALDRKALTAELGPERIQRFVTMTTYRTLRLKKVA